MSKYNKKNMKTNDISEDVSELTDLESDTDSETDTDSEEFIKEICKPNNSKKSIECNDKLKVKSKGSLKNESKKLDIVKVKSKSKEKQAPFSSENPKEVLKNDLKKVDKVEVVKVKKQMSEAQKNALANARLKRSEKLKLHREKVENDKQSIQLIYEQNMEENLRKTMIPKYEKQIKKQILERLKDEKLNELKNNMD